MHSTRKAARLLGLTTLATLGLAAAPTHAQILQNGSFETVSSPIGVYDGKTVYSSAASWTTSGDVLFTGAEGTTEGQQAATFNGGNGPTGGILSQTFGTQAGTVYTVTFDFGAFGSPGTEKLAAAAIGGGQTLGGTTALALGPSAPADFQPYSFQFKAVSAATTLTFNDTGSDTVNVDGVLDHVRVVAPEPSSVVAFAFAGLGALGLILRARKRRALV